MAVAQKPSSAAEATSHRYQSLFPEVSPASSRELLRETFSSSSTTSDASEEPPVRWKLRGQNALLVDVRTRPEREVSMIAGAISLEEFEESVLPWLLLKKEDDTEGATAATPDQLSKLIPWTNLPSSNGGMNSNTHDDGQMQSVQSLKPGLVAMYCTIGYRSGMEARRLQQDYPSIFQQPDDNDDGRNERADCSNQEANDGGIEIVNLDGILPFANATLDVTPGIPSYSEGSCVETETVGNLHNHATALIIEPTTKQPTNRLHVYGPSWKNLLSTENHYDAVVFSRMEFARRGMAVLGRSCCLLGCHRCKR